jgi:hypothetical protein
MNKKAISVTLDAENLTWLKGRVGASGLRSVSDLLDRLVTDARSRRSVAPDVRSRDDRRGLRPAAAQADATVRDPMDASLGRPLMVKETKAEYQLPRRKKRPRG